MTLKRTITGVLIDTEKKTASRVTLNDDLSALYKALNCRLVDFTIRTVAGRTVGIICDDEGLLTDDPIISAFTGTYAPALCGNLFVVSPYADDEGNWLSLPDDDIAHVIRNARIFPTRRHPEGVIALYPCDY